MSLNSNGVIYSGAIDVNLLFVQWPEYRREFGKSKENNSDWIHTTFRGYKIYGGFSTADLPHWVTYQRRSRRAGRQKSV